jgi:hypothetical protein
LISSVSYVSNSVLEFNFFVFLNVKIPKFETQITFTFPVCYSHVSDIFRFCYFSAIIYYLRYESLTNTFVNFSYLTTFRSNKFGFHIIFFKVIDSMPTLLDLFSHVTSDNQAVLIA